MNHFIENYTLIYSPFESANSLRVEFELPMLEARVRVAVRAKKRLFLPAFVLPELFVVVFLFF